MTWHELLKEGEELLRGAGVPDAGIDSRYLLEEAAGMDAARMVLLRGEAADPAAAEAFLTLVRRRAGREPLQYILGEAWFMGLPFAVRPGVLIPRQDTETLVEKILEDISGAGIRPEELRILDIGTGSGCIAVSLAKLGRAGRTDAVDISPEALAVAGENARRNNCTDIHFIESDLFENVEPGKKYDIIVSNPPYITKDEMEELMPEVIAFEPERALYGGTDGLAVYRRIAREAPGHLKPGGRIYLEIGMGQAEEVKRLLAENGFSGLEVVKDLPGRDRVVAGRLTGE